MRKRCRACGGEFETEQADGLRYFHACPPIDVIRVQRAGQVLTVPVRELLATDTIRVQRNGSTVQTLVSAELPGDQRIDVRTVDRPRKRDENLDPRAAPGVRQPKAEGDGVDDAA